MGLLSVAGSTGYSRFWRHRVQPEEVEHVLEQRAEIDEAAVVKLHRGDVEVLGGPQYASLAEKH